MEIIKYIIFHSYILPNIRIKISVTEKIFVLEKNLPIFCEEMKVTSNRITLADVYLWRPRSIFVVHNKIIVLSNKPLYKFM